MKNKSIKRKIIIAAIALLAIVAGVGSAFAFLSSKDSKENIFTLGNIQIELWEKFDTDANGRISGVDGNGQIIDLSAKNDEIYGPEEQSVVGENVIPGANIGKSPWIKNSGDRDAYVYMDVKVPYLNASELEGLFDAGLIGDGKPLFTFKHYENGVLVDGFNTEDWSLIGEYYPSNISGDPYNKKITKNVVEYVFAYRNPETNDRLPAKENNDTPPLFDAVAFDTWISEETFPVLQAYFKDNRSFASMWNRLVSESDGNLGLISSLIAGVFGSGEELDMTFANIIINGYAIQADLDESADVESSVDAWRIFAKQTDWNIQTGDEIIILQRNKSVIVSKNMEYYYYDAEDGFVMPYFTEAELVDGQYRWMLHFKDETTGSENGYPFYLMQGEKVSPSKDIEGAKRIPEYLVQALRGVENGADVSLPSSSRPVCFVYKDEPTKLYDTGGNYIGEFNIDSEFEYNDYMYPFDSSAGIIYQIRRVTYYSPVFDYSLDYICFEHLDGQKEEYGLSSSANKFYPVVDHIPDRSVSYNTIYFPEFNEYDRAHKADYWLLGTTQKTEGSAYYPSSWWSGTHMIVHSAEESSDVLDEGTYEMRFYPTPDRLCNQYYSRRGVEDEEIFVPGFDNVATFELPDSMTNLFPECSAYERWICDQDENFVLTPGERIIVNPSQFNAETRTLSFHPDIEGKVSVVLIDIGYYHIMNASFKTARAGSAGRIVVFEEADIINNDGTYKRLAFPSSPYPQVYGSLNNGDVTFESSADYIFINETEGRVATSTNSLPNEWWNKGWEMWPVFNTYYLFSNEYPEYHSDIQSFIAACSNN